MIIKKKNLVVWQNTKERYHTTEVWGAGRGSSIHERKLLDQLHVRQTQNLQIIV